MLAEHGFKRERSIGRVIAVAVSFPKFDIQIYMDMDSCIPRLFTTDSCLSLRTERSLLSSLSNPKAQRS